MRGAVSNYLVDACVEAFPQVHLGVGSGDADHRFRRHTEYSEQRNVSNLDHERNLQVGASYGVLRAEYFVRSTSYCVFLYPNERWSSWKGAGTLMDVVRGIMARQFDDHALWRMTEPSNQSADVCTGISWYARSGTQPPVADLVLFPLFSRTDRY